MKPEDHIKDQSFIPFIHPLIDLIHDPEGGFHQLLQPQQIQDGGN